MSDGGGEGILHLSRVTRRFGTVTAVDRLSLTLERGEFITLLGPSGCGKTTALRLIAGFETPDEGRILFEGADVTEVSPQRRGFGMVFQNYALFPHLNVFENVAFGLRSRKVPAPRIRERVAAALEVVDLEGYAERAVQALSGGQQQRVALARAVAIEPPLLLLDEPLSNLDQSLRVRTRTELRALVKELGITALFVTHDQEEAFALSDRIAVMRDGELRQIGTPEALYETPVDRFVAGFVGRANVLPVTLEPGRIRIAAGVHWPRPEAPTPGDGPLVLLLRPEELEFVEEGTAIGPGTPLPGVVRDRRFGGGTTLYRVEVPSEPDGSRADPGEGVRVLEVSAPSGAGPAPGSRIRLQPRPGARLHLFPAEAAS